MKEKAANYKAKRSPIKLILAIAALAMIGFAAFLGTEDLPSLDPGGSGATSQGTK